MRFWIVSELYYPDESATGYLLTKIAEGLSQFYPISVISCRNTQCADHTGHQVKEQRNGVTIWRSWVSHLDKNNLFFRLINATTSTIALFVRTLRLINAGDIVLVVTNPPFLPFVTKIACTLRGAKIMLLIHDVYPNVLVASGILKPLSIVSRLFDRLTRNLYKSVNAIIVLGRDMQHLVSEKIPSRNDHITIIRNWAETDTVYPLPKNENPYLKQLNLQDKFVLQYAGNMGRTHGLENILKCAISL
ncbi:MAG: glycosyltransferase, partial [Candidatus Nitrosotenuis sp.]